MPINFGSFGNVSPEGMQAVKDAIARRQGGEQAPALAQQGGTSPTAAPLPPQPESGVSVPNAVPNASPEVKEPSESVIIIKALDGRLKAISDVEKGMRRF